MGKEAEAAGKAPKKTKQQENAGKSASQKKAEMQAKRAADKDKKAGGWGTDSIMSSSCTFTWMFNRICETHFSWLKIPISWDENIFQTTLQWHLYPPRALLILCTYNIKMI